ncbi:MAG: MopE-related protein, partial [Candidatus Saccharibacteria bacterium]|nr:MopE-related protein [Candidatus Saccharibacteria bacterium]
GNTMCTLTAFKGEGTLGNDCDDTNASVNPGTAEKCDGVDNDCDKNTDEGCACVDSDKDGYDTCATGELGDDGKAEDCNDKAWDRSPGAVEICDGVDNDCDSQVDESGVCCADNDSDGYDGCGVGSEGDDGKVIDCDDASWFKNPGAPETCDNFDNNCNGEIDEKCDSDGDDYCNSAIRFYNYPVSVCPKSNLANDAFGNDCSDSNIGINPGVAEKCNGVDDDCDSQTDEGCTCTNGQTQTCGVNTGACQAGTQTCTNGSWGTCSGEIAPAVEKCADSIDNDCDGQTDENCSTCIDNDKDGFDNCAIGTAGDDGKVIDCNDNQEWSNPSGTETCDSVDNNCSGVADEGCDDDRDGYCDRTMKLYGNNSMCPSTVFTGNDMNGNDCNDTSLSINPGKAEVCGNGIDENCNGAGDDVCGETKMTLSIISPEESMLYESAELSFEYLATGGKGPYTYKVESNIDGVIYTGLERTFSGDIISLGKHTFTITAVDADGQVSTVTKELEIKPKPTLYIPVKAPMSGQKFLQGENVYFVSWVPMGVNVTISWLSDKDGIIGTKDFFMSNTLSVGVHNITFTATDLGGAVYTEKLQIEITNEPFLEAWPKLSSVEKGEIIYLSVKFSVNSPRSTYSISSDKDGLLSNSIMVDTSAMSLGQHLLTITGTSDTGESASATVVLEVTEAVCLDVDNDGYGLIESLACDMDGKDCNDDNNNINPGMTEDCDNGIDEDCDGYVDDCAVKVEMLLPATNDMSIERGNLVTFRLRAVGATYVRGYIQNPDAKQLLTFMLYDDGAHDDLLANDGVWANTWTAVGSSADRYYFDISLLRNGQTTYETHDNIRTLFLSESIKCLSTLDSGSIDDKFNILFIPDQFDSAEISTFATKVKTASDYLFSIIPFNANKNKVNIKRIDVVQNLGCDTGANCKAVNIMALAASCPYDEVVVLADSYFRSWAGQYAMVSMTYGNYSSVTVHELGHSFAGLADEYEEAGKNMPASSVTASVNCDTSSTCTKWSGVAGAGCFDGCYYKKGYYRSVSNGVMRSNSSKDFGVVNINRINTLFNDYK